MDVSLIYSQEGESYLAAGVRQEGRFPFHRANGSDTFVSGLSRTGTELC